MILKKRISLLLSFILLFSTFSSTGIGYAAGSPYYGIDVSTAHSNAFDIIFSPDNKLYVSEYTGNKIIAMDKSGDSKSTFFSPSTQPIGMIFDRDGNLYVAEHSGSKVLKIDSSGNSSTILNSASGLLTGITIDSNNKLFVLNLNYSYLFYISAERRTV